MIAKRNPRIIRTMSSGFSDPSERAGLGRAVADHRVGRAQSLVTRGLFAGGFLLVFLGAQAVPPHTPKTTLGQDGSAIFESKIRPILQAKCVACHGPNLQAGDIRLDEPISADVAARLAKAISYTDEVEMPPSGKLPPDELAYLTKWAEAGAPWPETPTITSEAAFWAFVAPQHPDVPEVTDRVWGKNPIDAFILEKLEDKGFEPAPPVDRRTLIRRATFDLTGLPPTPQEIEAFLADTEPEAFERLIDRLLATPAYGERWGRHWLDVARYADSNGLDENLVFPNAWRYRDWVINAVNDDKPIDEFLKEQLAGDLLPNAGDDEIIATGFLSIGAKMLAEDDPDKMEYDIIDEQIDTFSKAYLGLTMACARCHDHKFDPIPAKDYYALAGIFKSTKTMVNHKVVAQWVERPIGSKADQEKLSEIEAEVKTRRDTADEKRKAAGDALLKEIRAKKAEYEAAGRELLERDGAKANLKAAIDSPNGDAPSDAIVWESEDFKSSNLKVDKGGYGKEIGVLLNIGKFPNFADYEIEVSAAGPYQLDLRYAAGDARPVKIFANGTLVISSAASKVTGGFYPQHQVWEAEGIFELKAGKNLIRIERENFVPHIDKLLLIPRPGQKPTELLGAIASGQGLLAEVVRATADQIKKGDEIKLNLPDKADHLFEEPVASELKQLEKEIADLNKTKPVVPMAMAVREGEPTNLKVQLRGNYLTEGEEAPRRFPTAVTGPDHPELASDTTGRLELADWIIDEKNPLTARVFVNRVWRWRFGRGLVGTVDNFGALGDLPSHPELLDWLATTFVEEDGWSLKKLHKRLMLTNTYQMGGEHNAEAAEFDPENRLRWKFSRKRLEAEAIRDSILFVAGQLDREMGGSLINLNPRQYVTSNNNIDPIKYDSRRRSLYLPVIRSALYDVYTAFDFGDPTVMNGNRPSTTVAPQALFMLNSSIVLSASKDLAANMLAQEGWTDSQRVQHLYQTCYGRPASADEVSTALEFIPKFEAAFGKAENPRLSAWQSLCKSVLASNEFVYVE